MMLLKINLNRKKITSIVNNVLTPVHKERLSNILKKTIFSILIDESTDTTAMQSFCINVRYLDDDTSTIKESLWE